MLPPSSQSSISATPKSSGRSRRKARSPTNSRWSERFSSESARKWPGLNASMSWLATTATVSPFIGLLGTVFGIIRAFAGIAQAGSSSLRAVAPGISEALIVTAFGLAAAIPAAVAYNYFGTTIREFGTRMEDFSLEFLNLAERSFED